MEGFDADAVRERAAALLLKHKNAPEEARTHYLAAILDWSDYYTETFPDPADPEARQFLERLASLWASLANMLGSLRQYRQAAQVFEDALKDPLVGGCASTHIAYAQYFRDRDKLPSAQKVYLRALSGRLAQPEVDALWTAFLQLLRLQGERSLTLAQLVEAVSEQVEDKTSLAAPSPECLAAAEARAAEEAAGVTASAPVDMDAADPAVLDAEASQTGAPAALPVDESEALTDEEFAAPADEAPLLAPEDLLRAHQRKPPLLFSAPGKEPMSRGLRALSAAELGELEVFFGTPLATYTPSAAADSKLDRVLDVLEALWTTQALREKVFDRWFAEIRQVHEQERAVMRREWEVRAARVGREAALVRDQGDQNRFLNRCAVQGDLLLASVNRTLHGLVCAQLRALACAGLPQVPRSLAEDMRLSGGRYSPALCDAMDAARRVACALLSLRPLALAAPARARPQSSPPSSSALHTSAPVLAPLTRALPITASPTKNKKRKRRNFLSSVAAPGELAKYGPGVDSPPEQRPFRGPAFAPASSFGYAPPMYASGPSYSAPVAYPMYPPAGLAYAPGPFGPPGGGYQTAPPALYAPPAHFGPAASYGPAPTGFGAYGPVFAQEPGPAMRAQPSMPALALAPALSFDPAPAPAPAKEPVAATADSQSAKLPLLQKLAMMMKNVKK